MGLKNSQYHAIMRKYEQKQLHSHDIQVARYEDCLLYTSPSPRDCS